jgi:hypothetical protein
MSSRVLVVLPLLDMLGCGRLQAGAITLLQRWTTMTIMHRPLRWWGQGGEPTRGERLQAGAITLLL